MGDPLNALVWAVLLMGVAGVLFWPESGYFWRWQRANTVTERVLHLPCVFYMYNRVNNF